MSGGESRRDAGQGSPDGADRASTSAPPPSRIGERRARRMLLMLAAIAIAPVALSYAFYYLFPRESRVNYGELLPTQAATDVAGTAADGRRFRLSQLRGRWVVIAIAGGACDTGCERMLYATRQARTMQNAEEDRVVRLWLVPDGVPPRPGLTTAHPGLQIVQVDPQTPRLLPRGDQAIYLVDPLGNQVLAWPREPDIKALSRDLTRLLKASRIG